MSFADLGLSPELVQAVTDAGYQEPTPIQAQAIPYVLMGRDVLGVAQTGTGKTASFTLPMIDILASGRAKARMPRSLIIEPTRELAMQVAENFEKYGKYHKLTMALLIGGVSFGDQTAALERGVDVLIATPGRLLDQFERGKILMTDVRILVIDEADRMLDMGFIPDVEKIVSLLSPMRQTLFFSATMQPEIRRLADNFLQNPKEISVSRPATTATTVAQHVTILDDLDKREALRRIIRAEDVKNAIIFCNRKRDVDILHKSLSKHGFNAGCLHGDMAQSVRIETLDRFKKGEISLLVASDVAARGIDVSDLSHVFNFDVPISPDDYVHRIGRTGRAGKTGRAFMLATPEETRALLAIEKLTGQEIPRHVVDGIESLPLMSDEELKARKRGRGRISQRSGQRSDEARGGRGDRDRGRGRDRDRKGGRDRAYGRAEAKLAEIAADLPIAAEATKPEAPRPEHPKREDRWDNRRNRGEGSRGDERRDGDDRTVIGFGEFTPAFMLRKPTLPPPLDAEGSEVPREARRAGQPIRAESVAFEEEKAETANREGKPAARSRKRKPKGSPEIGPEIGQTAAEPAGGEAVAEESASVTAPEAAPAAKPKRAASRKPKAAAKTAAASDQPDVEAAAPSDAPAKPRRGRAAAAKAKPEAADIGASAGKSRARRKAPRKADADTAAPPEGDDQN